MLMYQLNQLQAMPKQKVLIYQHRPETTSRKTLVILLVHYSGFHRVMILLQSSSTYYYIRLIDKVQRSFCWCINILQLYLSSFNLIVQILKHPQWATAFLATLSRSLCWYIKTDSLNAGSFKHEVPSYLFNW